MVTFWQTTPGPNMDNPLMRPSAQSLQRPQVFVKVEFGVSWSGQHSPRTHGIEFKSRALRERDPGFPRTVPAPTTNYLAAPSVQPFRGSDAARLDLHHAPQERAPPRRIQHTEFRDTPNYDPSYLLPAPYLHERSEPRHIEAIPEPPPLGPFPPAEERRQSRAEWASSSADRHQRGSSAPPPLSENNWDVVSAQSGDRALAGRSTAHRAGPQARTNSDVWKDLPEVPSRFRLGEDGMPWESTWQFPMGFEPFLEPDPYLRPPSSAGSLKPSSEHSSQRPRTPEQRGRHVVESPPQGDDPARRHELEALGHAMMTVDNGFENQWWNQGERRHLTAVTPPPATRQQMEEQMALGWVGALLPAAGPGDDGSRRFTYPSPETTSAVSPEGSVGASYSNMVVSPISTFSVPATQLSRTLSTRSDELWFGHGSARYA